jgi:hypothetical protein
MCNPLRELIISQIFFWLRTEVNDYDEIIVDSRFRHGGTAIQH